MAKKEEEAKTDGVIDKVVLEQFKHTGSEAEHWACSSTGGEAEDCEAPELQLSRKRKTFEGFLYYLLSIRLATACTLNSLSLVF